MNRKLIRLVLFSMALFTLFTSLQASRLSFGGVWEASYGKLRMTQRGSLVLGSYGTSKIAGTLEGKMTQGRLEFTYKEGKVAGEGWFKIDEKGQNFSGQWRAKGHKKWQIWSGRRLKITKKPAKLFGGLWTGNYGRMRLVQQGLDVNGIYSLAGGSSVTGKCQGRHLKFSYAETKASGEGWFDVSEDGMVLHGKWRPKGDKKWKSWNCHRVERKRGVNWLVVVEAPWQGGLEEREYSFGEMLKSFFAGSETVKVRQRFFTDGKVLQRWCREVAYLAEPVVLCISTHGTPAGFTVSGQTIKAEDFADGLKYASTLKLLHFSSCEIMKGTFPHQLRKLLTISATSGASAAASFPMSGYTTAVDWAGSAILEFLYLDFILERGMKPALAASGVLSSLNFAGNKKGGPIVPLGFTFLKAK